MQPRLSPHSDRFHGSQKVILHRQRKPGIVHICSEQPDHMIDKSALAIDRQRQELPGDRRCTHEPGNESGGYGIAHRPMFETDVGVPQARAISEFPKFGSRIE